MARRARSARLALLALVAVLLAGAGSLATPPSAAAALPAWTGGMNLYRSGTFTTQQTWRWCTAADVQLIRNIVRQLETPDRLRGRMIGVNMVFFVGGPQLGEVEAGLVASLFASAVTGVTVSIVFGGVMTLIAAAVVGLATPVIRDYGSHTDVG